MAEIRGSDSEKDQSLSPLHPLPPPVYNQHPHHQHTMSETRESDAEQGRYLSPLLQRQYQQHPRHQHTTPEMRESLIDWGAPHTPSMPRTNETQHPPPRRVAPTPLTREEVDRIPEMRGSPIGREAAPSLSTPGADETRHPPSRPEYRLPETTADVDYLLAFARSEYFQRNLLEIARSEYEYLQQNLIPAEPRQEAPGQGRERQDPCRDHTHVYSRPCHPETGWAPRHGDAYSWGSLTDPNVRPPVTHRAPWTPLHGHGLVPGPPPPDGENVAGRRDDLHPVGSYQLRLSRRDGRPLLTVFRLGEDSRWAVYCEMDDTSAALALLPPNVGGSVWARR